MKTNKKALYIIGLMAALCVGFLIGISIEFPRTDREDVAGTVGKAAKYRKTKMTANDIKLRSELLKDTSQLKEMIQGLIYFSTFTEETCAKIDLAVFGFQTVGLKDQSPNADKMNALADYAKFIRNNNETLNATIAMLSGFYLNDTINQSLDVEKNLKDFGIYVNQINAKDSILSEALLAMDNFLMDGEALQKHLASFKELKSIRDQLLIKGIQLSGLVGNQEQVGILIFYGLDAQEKLNLVLGQEKLERLFSQDKLQRLFSNEELKLILFDKELSLHLFNQEDLASGLNLIYNQAGLSFLLAEGSQVNAVASQAADLQSAGNYKSLCLLGNEKLDVILDQYNLQRLFMSPALSGFLDSYSLNRILSVDNSLGRILSNESLSFILLSAEGLGSLLNLLANENLGSL
jgi:hypothetical protein